ncbi:Phosphoribosylglycinamide formyltransferase [compost metagenome]
MHFVTPELDHGPIVIQAALDVLPSDTPESLAERLLDCEHQIYPRAVRWFVEDRLQLQDGVVNVINPAEPQLLMAISAHTPAAGVKA